MAEPEIEACREALAAYLTTALSAAWPSLKVMPEWPTGALPEQAITVLATNAEPDVYPHAPIAISTTPTSGASGLVTYEYGKIEGIQLQLDCWATTKPKRDLLQLAVRRALAQPPQLTLPGANDGRPRFGHRSGLSLSIANLFGAIFTFRFSGVPTLPESSSSAQKNEWRSSFRGTAEGPMWDQDTIAIRKRLSVTGKVGAGLPGTGIPISIIRT